MKPLLLPALTTIVISLAASAAAATSRSETLFFDATFAHASESGPPANETGHKQIADGVLHDASGRPVGSFAFTCYWVAILANNDAQEHCTGWGHTADGRLDVAGPARRSDGTHTWSIANGSGAYRGSHGTLLVRDLGPTESLIILELSGARAALRVGVVQQPAVNTRFRTRASVLCRQAAAALARLPRFPFTNFDPTHPDPELLPRIGRFFTGSGDPRPALRRLDGRLRALGQPPAERPAWARYLAGRRAENAARQQQDNAALAADVQVFVKGLHDIDTAGRRTAIAAAVFGVPDCTL